MYKCTVFINFSFVRSGLDNKKGPDRTRPTALQPPRSYGKPEAAAAVDGQEDARNMLSCI
jgi:hypothetical protein